MSLMALSSRVYDDQYALRIGSRGQKNVRKRHGKEKASRHHPAEMATRQSPRLPLLHSYPSEDPM